MCALRRTVLLRQASQRSHHRLSSFSSVSAVQPHPSHVGRVASSAHTGHLSVLSSDVVTKNRSVSERVRWILSQPERRVLVLTGGGGADSSLRAELARGAAVFELERRGHGVFGVREFCQQMLRETGRDKRVFGRAQLAAFLMHHRDALPVTRFHQGTASSSTLQRRKSIQDLLQLVRLLESEAVTPELYGKLAAFDQETPADLTEAYAVYQELLAQHNATSWDGLVLDVLALCGAERRPEGVEPSEAATAAAREFSDALLRGYTDVVLDDTQRLTPAMARLVGHLCAQPSVQSSTSFGRVLFEGESCSRTQILEQQMLETAARIRQQREVTQATLAEDEASEEGRKLVQMRVFAQQLMSSSSGKDKQKVEKASSVSVSSPCALQCWSFETAEDEEQAIGTFLAEKLELGDLKGVTVLCPSHADAHRVALALGNQGLPVRMDDGQFSAAVTSSGVPIHLFDEPGVNAVYSLLCALCYPSDSRHLYNVLRSDFFAFPAELLSRLVEKEHKSHVDLFQVLEAFVESDGKSLFASLQQRDDGQQSSPPASLQLETGLQSARAFVKLIKRLRVECHDLSAAEIVQSFLEETGRLETLLSPSCPEHERESLALADFLRELETAQSVVKSAHVAFVAPYLLQMRETHVSSSASWHELSPVVGDGTAASATEEANVRVLPMTIHALESLESLASSVDGNDADVKQHLLVLMSMRDSKFPGRMKRLTLPLPYALLSRPYPVQTRAEHLTSCEQLAYRALTLGIHNEVVLSFAALAATSSPGNDVRTKREVLSRTFQPIWHEGDHQPLGGSRVNGGLSKGSAASLSREASTAHVAATQSSSTPPSPPEHFWLSEVVDLVREFVGRIFLPIWRHKEPPSAVVSDPKDDRAKQVPKDEFPRPPVLANRRPAIEEPVTARRSAAPASSGTYEPSHLSYSQISEYLRCPHQYYLSRVMKLEGDVSTSMMFGRALHEGVAAFATTLAAAQLDGDVSDEAKTLAAVEAEEAFARAWVGDGHGLFASKEQSEFFFDRGVVALWEFMRSHHEDPRLQEILHVEHDFAFHVPEANVELRGVWDRIDRVSSGDGSGSSFVIKEFKSNMGGADRDMRKLAAESLQLKMYMYAFRRVVGEAPLGAKLQLIGGESVVKDNSKRRRRTVDSGEDGLVLFSEAAAQEAEAAIVEVASGLRRGAFEPTPGFAECAFCPYAGSACHSATDAAAHMNEAGGRRTSRSAGV
ncbi:hypothetical protein BBJ28_00013059 [Nothophytophthora sp. Chile5]|nr:hypothetical protein BBJ28_00013059 [Nothophytophthora sp. Chile5]